MNIYFDYSLILEAICLPVFKWSFLYEHRLAAIPHFFPPLVLK